MFFTALLVTINLLFFVGGVLGFIWVIVLWADLFGGNSKFKWVNVPVMSAITIAYVYFVALGITALVEA